MDTDTARIAHGGKGLYGSRVGILMLETKFPRIPGDMGNGLTWPFPVLYKIVPGATPDRVGRAFEYRELPDEAQHERHILRDREADGDLGRAHRSRHSRGPLPGGPKSRGASPA